MVEVEEVVEVVVDVVVVVVEVGIGMGRDICGWAMGVARATRVVSAGVWGSDCS